MPPPFTLAPSDPRPPPPQSHLGPPWLGALFSRWPPGAALLLSRAPAAEPGLVKAM